MNEDFALNWVEVWIQSFVFCMDEMRALLWDIQHVMPHNSSTLIVSYICSRQFNIVLLFKIMAQFGIYLNNSNWWTSNWWKLHQTWGGSVMNINQKRKLNHIKTPDPSTNVSMGNIRFENFAKMWNRWALKITQMSAEGASDQLKLQPEQFLNLGLKWMNGEYRGDVQKLDGFNQLQTTAVWCIHCYGAHI